MKKLLPLFVVGFLVLSGLGAVSVANNTIQGSKVMRESVVFSNPVIKDIGAYVTVDLEEVDSSFIEVEKPMLPFVTKVFTFPFGTSITGVHVSFSGGGSIDLSKPVKLAPEPLMVGSINLQTKAVKSNVNTGLYPPKSYDYKTGMGLDGEEHVLYVAVQCYPIRYSDVTNKIYYSQVADIQITYEEPVNPTTFNDEYDMVIISPSEFSNTLQTLIEHKNNNNVRTTLKTTEAIYSEYSGYDEAEKIKYYIKDAIETLGVNYVLLIGSVDKLPIRTTWFFQRHHEYYWNETVLSDLYFADIYDAHGDFCSWDSNGNGLYGEVYRNCPGINDTVDLYPDVNIGRIPCQKISELKTVINKIIHYETSTYGESWFKNMILIGGDTFPGWNGYEGEEKNSITESIMAGFSPTRLWASDGTLTARNINRAINNGAGFIDYSGHGFEIGVGTHPPNDEEKWISYYTPYLAGALNGYKLPIIFFDACLTARLDFNWSSFFKAIKPAEVNSYPSIENIDAFDYIQEISGKQIVGSPDPLSLGDKLFPCFAWCFVKKSFGGAIATIGATRTAYGGIGMGCGYLSLQYYRAYASSETVSEMLTKAQNNYINNIWWDYFTVEEFILIGDPSLKIGGYPTNDNSQNNEYTSQNNQQSIQQYQINMINQQSSNLLQVIKTTKQINNN
ncbi:MAG: C25 family cysteine peptidase [Candidatus Thermoplasmatota archaeon]|jgi:hypothetical protein|nr:C25 family cysteine peptidase [Candidatus Thermoplasmatota archaeon]